ncbi:MAG: ionic transporter y4hA [Novosphingobium sp.]|jgi:Ca2+:H+ antiporter|nr:ionic transporter y4hA [Novosphingobium sp.]
MTDADPPAPLPPALPPPARFPGFGLAAWSIVLPWLGLAALALGKPAGPGLVAGLGLLLGLVVMTAVYHAEIVAHHLGEPFGTLVLALAVTIIETSLIVSIIFSAGAQTLARDTLIAAIMITINGIVGLCLLAGGRRYHEQGYTQSGVSAGLAMLATLAVLTLVLPNYTTSAAGPFYSPSQLAFVAVVSLVVYATFVVAQTIRHRDHFLYPEDGDYAHEAPVPRARAMAAGVMLVAALAAVVLLAKALSPAIEAGLRAIGAPEAMVGIVIAALVLAPEGLAAIRAARANRVQTSLNLAIGSALATIGLTIPAVAITALVTGLHLELGLSVQGTVILALTLLVASLTLGTGRTTMVQGVIHLVIFATWLFTMLVP